MKSSIPEGTLFVSRFTAWAPGLDSPHAWDEWVKGCREIPAVKDGPSLTFTEPLFRRRLSQLSRMTIQVLHDLLPFNEKTKVVFLSFRGEISQQFKLNKMIIEDHAVLPAAFSLSVFNAPPALAAIALNLTAGYTAVYPAGGFRPAFLAAATPVLSGSAGETVLVYADELCPPEYGDLKPADNTPLAFAVLLSASADGNGAVPLAVTHEPPDGTIPDTPQEFLKYLFRADDKM